MKIETYILAKSPLGILKLFIVLMGSLSTEPKNLFPVAPENNLPVSSSTHILEQFFSELNKHKYNNYSKMRSFGFNKLLPFELLDLIS